MRMLLLLFECERGYEGEDEELVFRKQENHKNTEGEGGSFVFLSKVALQSQV